MAYTSTVFRIHYRTQFGDFISIRGSSQGLSWTEGIETSWVTEEGEDVWVLTLPLNHFNCNQFSDSDSDDSNNNENVIHFKPLINDEVWAKGYDYVVSPGGIIDVYPFFFSEKGSVFKSIFKSHSLGNERKIATYLPPSYGENPFKKYPVILFQDGHNLFDSEDSFCGDTWQMSETMDELSCNGGIQEYIVVGIYPLDREWEYLPTKCGGVGGGADRYLDALSFELRPLIDKHLRTLPHTNSAIAGSSYGGIISLYAWATRPDQFDLCGAFSPALKFDNKIVPQIVKRSLQARPQNHKLYMDCGSVRDQADAVIELATHLISNGPLSKEQFQFVFAEGHAHTERHWAIRTPRALSYLFSDPLRYQPLLVSENEIEQQSDGDF